MTDDVQDLVGTPPPSAPVEPVAITEGQPDPIAAPGGIVIPPLDAVLPAGTTASANGLPSVDDTVVLSPAERIARADEAVAQAATAPPPVLPTDVVQAIVTAQITPPAPPSPPVEPVAADPEQHDRRDRDDPYRYAWQRNRARKERF